MAGFLGTSTALTIFDIQIEPDAEKIRKHAFTPTPGPDGKCLGWVGLGDPLDEDFSFGINQGRFMAFSLRVDERKPSGAAIKIRLAEAVKEEMAANGKISAKRKKELKEQITAAVTAKTEFIPTLIDCIVDTEAGRLYVGTTSAASLKLVLEQIQRSFGKTPQALTPSTDMSAVFARMFRENLSVDGAELSPCGYSVTLATPQQQEEKAKVVVANNEAAIASALSDGLRITKMVVSVADGEQTHIFSLDETLAVSSLKLPKGEKGDDPDASFLLKADVLSRVARLVEAMGK